MSECSLVFMQKTSNNTIWQGMNRPVWKHFIALLEQYLKASTSRETPVINYLPATQLSEALALGLGQQGCTDTELIKEISNYLKYSQNSAHPLFHNQLNAGSNFESLVAEIISSVTNTTMSTYEVAPVATLIEEKLIEEICHKIGFHHGDGLMLTGGSNANLMAIHVARSERFPDIRRLGNGHYNMCVFVSSDAHYSHNKAMMLLGLGLDNLILVDTDQEGRMIPSDLEAKIKKSIAEDKIPLMLCSTAGTTVLGAFDLIRKNDEICKKYGLWHHVDGSWGGAVMLSQKHGHLLDGLPEADSFTFDAHKLLGAGLITSFFFAKKKDVLLRANSAPGTHYLFHDYESAEHDTGRKSLQCGRKVDSLKMWLIWKARGHEGMARYIDDQFEKQNFFTNLVREHPRLQLVHNPEYLNVCFQVIPKDPKIDVNQYNYKLRFKLAHSGKMMVNYSTFQDGTVFLRQVFANQNTTKDDLKYMVDTLLEMAD
jgi:glutamate/tyrosine decarboxylase-like PLP-dependent enzyme